MKHKKLFVTFTVIFSLLLALIIFFMIWFWGDRYDGGATFEGFNDFRSEIVIPGLKDGACPQGIATYKANYTETVTDEDGEEKTVTKKQDYFFISAYLKNQPSRIYVVGNDTGEVGYVTLKNPDGSDYTGHCGGIAVNGYYLWVSSDDKVFFATKDKLSSTDNITLDIIKLAEEHGSIQFKSYFNANCNASFLYYYDADGEASGSPSSSDRLYVGEFYRSGNYETNEKHHVTTKNDETNRAFAYEYNVSISATRTCGLAPVSGTDDGNGVAAPKIQKIFSLPNEIQGFARTANGIVLSQSYGLKNSHIYYHKFDWSTSSNNSYDRYLNVDKAGFKYDGVTTASGAPYYDTSTSLNLYYLDTSSLLNDYSIPSMSEGMCTLDGRVYVLFESGANKYKPFVRKVLKNVYSFVPRKSDKF
ncbi:MAG: hypothetical protein K2O89_01805 [Clostridia bacterium]|nr:hypothetical protein [Clostridia bacterium]